MTATFRVTLTGDEIKDLLRAALAEKGITPLEEPDSIDFFGRDRSRHLLVDGLILEGVTILCQLPKFKGE